MKVARLPGPSLVDRQPCWFQSLKSFHKSSLVGDRIPCDTSENLDILKPCLLARRITCIYYSATLKLSKISTLDNPETRRVYLGSISCHHHSDTASNRRIQCWGNGQRPNLFIDHLCFSVRDVGNSAWQSITIA